MCQAEFAGTCGVSFTDELGKGNSVMWCAKRALPNERLERMKISTDTINFGDLKGRFESQQW